MTRSEKRFVRFTPDEVAQIQRVAGHRGFSEFIRMCVNAQLAQEGDPCPQCDGGELTMHRAIEVGHIFKLGTVYTEQLGAGRLEWKLYTTPVVLSIMQLLKNGESEERRYDLAMQKNILAAKTAADDLGIALFATTQVTNAVDTLDNAVAACAR